MILLLICLLHNINKYIKDSKPGDYENKCSFIDNKLYLIVLLSKYTNIAQSAGAVEYPDCFSADGQDCPLTSVLDMTLNNLMVRFQQCWALGECRVPLRCHCSQVHSGPE